MLFTKYKSNGIDIENYNNCSKLRRCDTDYLNKVIGLKFKRYDTDMKYEFDIPTRCQEPTQIDDRGDLVANSLFANEELCIYVLDFVLGENTLKEVESKLTDIGADLSTTEYNSSEHYYAFNGKLLSDKAQYILKILSEYTYQNHSLSLAFDVTDDSM